MAGGTTSRSTPHGLRRLALRFPIWLYRARLGWLLGERFLLLTHTGRKSGHARQTVLEVVAHEREARRYVVASGWGERADWFQNVMQHPAVQIAVGRRHAAATAQRLSIDEGARVLAAYVTRHPTAFRALGRIMLGEPVTADAEGYARLAARVPFVALTY